MGLSTWSLRARFICLAFLWVWHSPAPGQEVEVPAAAAPVAKPWEAEKLDVADLKQALEEATQARAKAPSDAKEDTLEGRLGVSLGRRVDLLKELTATAEARSRIRDDRDSRPSQEAELEERLKEVQVLPAVAPPLQATSEGFEELESKLAAQRKALEELKEKSRAREQRLAEAGDLRRQYADQGAQAEARILLLSDSASGAKEGLEKQLLTLQLGNARIAQRLAKEAIALLDDEAAMEKDFADYRNDQLDYVQRLVSRLEEEYALYQAALEQTLEMEQQAKEQALEQKKADVEQAVTEGERFLAGIEAQIAEVGIRASQLKRRQPLLSSLRNQQEKRLQSEKDRLQSLQDLVAKGSQTRRLADRLKTTYTYVKRLRKNPKLIFTVDVVASLDEHRTRRFEVDELLLNLPETWAAEYEPALATVSQSDRSSFEARAADLRTSLRTALLEEQSLLSEVIGDENKLQDISVELYNTIEQLEQFLLPRLFWIRDAEPLGVETIEKAAKEVGIVSGWVRQFATSTASTGIDISGFQTLVLITLLLILPVLLVLIGRRIRRSLTAKDDGGGKAQVTVLAVVNAGLFPALLAVVSVILGALELPSSLGTLLSNAAWTLAQVCLYWTLARALFCRNRIGEVGLGMSRDVAQALRRFSDRVFFHFILILFIPLVLREDPFKLETLPRLGYTAFGLSVLLPLLVLLRKRSPVGGKAAAILEQNVLGKNWNVLVLAVLSALLGSLVMDALGYRYGGSRIAERIILSLFAGLALLGLYQVALATVSRWLSRRFTRRKGDELSAEPAGASTSDPGEEASIASSPEGDLDMNRQRRFIKIVFVILGTLLLAVVWHVDEQVFRSLDQMPVYTMTTSVGPEVVSVADVLSGVLTMAVMLWLLKYLPSIYELTVFPRVKFDAGLRYAFLTISRYGILFIGCLVALSSIHLDLGRIGWLMAAIGFGLGFGLQEIISNFVSGIILLVERPVRVGDVVKVGNVLGTVNRINIRATTVTDFDRLEVVIPNKDLITKEVTNWTLADKTTRIVIKIGVAYGTDIRAMLELLVDLARQQPEVLKEPAPSAYFLSHGESSLDFELRCFVPETSFRLPLTSRLNTLINEALQARNIEIPFPQRDIHIRSDDTRGRASEKERSL